MNPSDLVTKYDLERLKIDLLTELKLVLEESRSNKKWVRAKDIMEHLNVSYSQVKNLRIRGDIKAKKLGGVWYYNMHSIEKQLDSDDGNG